MNTETILQALDLMVQGMIGIFVVLGVIALLVVIMQKLDSRKK
jgi:Na+-transporting methylmalonyl-CoA/oxaloacetate decarboxylase gamma subunit